MESRFSGVFLDGYDATPVSVYAVTDTGTITLFDDQNERLGFWNLEDCMIEPALGSTRRVLKLPEGRRFESMDLASMAEIELLLGHGKGMQIVHFMERYWSVALACGIAIILVVWAIAVFGIPVVATHASRAVPDKWMYQVSEKTLEALESSYLDESTLEKNQQDRLSKRMAELSQAVGEGKQFRLLFRASEQLKANALALPDGTIIMTDDLVKMAETDDELAGIMLHEMGHVIHRHGIRQIIQQGSLFVMVAVITGDITAITSIAGTLPTLLAESGYSRDFEREADRFAGQYFMDTQGSTEPVRVMLERLGEDHHDLPAQNYWGTHPTIEQRVMLLKEMETE